MARLERAAISDGEVVDVAIEPGALDGASEVVAVCRKS
jgi:hypothetical protein